MLGVVNVNVKLNVNVNAPVFPNRQKPPYYFYSDLNPPKKRKIGKCKKQPYYFILVPVPFKSRKDYASIGTKKFQTKISKLVRELNP